MVLFSGFFDAAELNAKGIGAFSLYKNFQYQLKVKVRHESSSVRSKVELMKAGIE